MRPVPVCQPPLRERAPRRASGLPAGARPRGQAAFGQKARGGFAGGGQELAPGPSYAAPGVKRRTHGAHQAEPGSRKGKAAGASTQGFKKRN